MAFPLATYPVQLTAERSKRDNLNIDLKKDNSVDPNKNRDTPPDLIVGIDIGMTCTGVAYLNHTTRSKTVQYIQSWPGMSNGYAKKVPTVVVYNEAKGQAEGVVSSWGFLSTIPTEMCGSTKEFREQFKVYLDPIRLQVKLQNSPMTFPRSEGDVDQAYADYLYSLYRHIEVILGSELCSCSWSDARIEFLFSVPASWHVSTADRFKHLVRRAGFGSYRNHNLTIGLTEPEAAAVHISLENQKAFNEGDVLLICDAGGRSTDFTILKVVSNFGNTFNLEQLDVVFGEDIGSIQIDQSFERTVQNRIIRIDPPSLGWESVERVSWEILRSEEFQSNKCSQGEPNQASKFKVDVRALNHCYSNDELDIRNGQMKFSRAEMQAAFDNQVKNIFTQIDNQIRNLLTTHPKEKVSQILLSGGLGNSMYVRERLKERYEANEIAVRVPLDPELAVCKGLVEDYFQSLNGGSPVFTIRRCRASYGIVCREEYDETNPDHYSRQEETAIDKVDGRRYLINSVEWFVRKGEPINTGTPITRKFRRRISALDSERVFPTTVMTSFADAESLPPYMAPGIYRLCDFQSDLSKIQRSEFKTKGKRFWNQRYRCYQIDYTIRVLIGPADIKFELVFNGELINTPESIKIDFTAAGLSNPTGPAHSEASIVRPLSVSSPSKWFFRNLI